MSETSNVSPKYLTLNDLRAKLANRSRSSIYSDLAAERLPKPFKLGGRLYWIEEEIDAHLRALRDGD
ncbi:AlpA family phage regulatory protein [Ruegeria pomeroyi]|nr:AlpA family phage regulatory protein [Ruegeria pomeroyi]